MGTAGGWCLWLRRTKGASGQRWETDNYGMKLGEMFWGGRRQARRRVNIQTPGSCGFIQFHTLQRRKRQDRTLLLHPAVTLWSFSVAAPALRVPVLGRRMSAAAGTGPACGRGLWRKGRTEPERKRPVGGGAGGSAYFKGGKVRGWLGCV